MFTRKPVVPPTDFTPISPRSTLRLVLTNLCAVIALFGIVMGVKYTINHSTDLGGSIVQSAKNTLGKAVGSTLGSPMIQDAQGNINVLLIGFGGDAHQGSYLADTMIVASYSPRTHSVSMLSLPRDLVVSQSGYINKLNTIFVRGYNKNRDKKDGVAALSAKIRDITSIDIPYYAMIDFRGFEKLIDSVGGIDLYVPKTIRDMTYPGPNYSYTTFVLQSGQQHLDGKTALKYARSRHSTSDFSRSQRQQAVIKAFISTLFASKNLSVSQIQTSYQAYTDIITTNITSSQMIGFMNYGTSIPAMHSFGYTDACTDMVWRTMNAGCLLYPGDSSAFGGMSILIPRGGSSNKISFYDYMTSFAVWTQTHHPLYAENTPIYIHNTISPKAKLPAGRRVRSGLAGMYASKMRRYGLNVVGVDNIYTIATSTGGYNPSTFSLIVGTGASDATIQGIQSFLSAPVQTDVRDLSGIMLNQILSGGVHIFIGVQTLEQLGDKRRSMYTF